MSIWYFITHRQAPIRCIQGADDQVDGTVHVKATQPLSDSRKSSTITMIEEMFMTSNSKYHFSDVTKIDYKNDESDGR
jgi:hypothetical protein